MVTWSCKGNLSRAGHPYECRQPDPDSGILRWNAGSKLGQRRRRWPSFEPAFHLSWRSRWGMKCDHATCCADIGTLESGMRVLHVEGHLFGGLISFHLSPRDKADQTKGLATPTSHLYVSRGLRGESMLFTKLVENMALWLKDTGGIYCPRDKMLQVPLFSLITFSII